MNRRATIGVVTAATVFVLVGWRWMSESTDGPAAETEAPEVDHALERRLSHVADARPDITRDEALAVVEASNVARDSMTPDEIYALLDEQVVTDEQVRAYYDAHRDLFGQRSLEASAEVIERMIHFSSTERSASHRGVPQRSCSPAAV
jgi:hypothetical protein